MGLEKEINVLDDFGWEEEGGREGRVGPLLRFLSRARRTGESAFLCFDTIPFCDFLACISAASHREYREQTDRLQYSKINGQR